MISNRHAEANNKYMEDFSARKSSNYMLYLDGNNVYGWALSRCLPLSDLRFLPHDEIAILDVTNISDFDDLGYILEVDLEYPNNLHDLQSDYPLALESMVVSDDMLSPYTQK